VYIAGSSHISGASLTYAGFFFALYLAAHIVARLTVPFADPYVLPIAALLTAIGLTEIYRLGPTDAFRQATIACSRTTSICSGLVRSPCSSCRCCRASGCA
jgi:peptidoglycan glycosyltransferase